MGGPRNWEGRVEVFWTGTWGAISDSQWSTTDANVVCKQLKHSPESGNNSESRNSTCFKKLLA